jgi:TPR repeat protein
MESHYKSEDDMKTREGAGALRERAVLEQKEEEKEEEKEAGGVQNNRPTKESWQLAAAQGNAAAQTRLANWCSYSSGDGTPGDDKRTAMELYETAAAQGEVEAQHALGRIYLAVSEGPLESCVGWCKLPGLSYDFTPLALAMEKPMERIYSAVKQTGAALLDKAAMQGHAEAQFDLACMHQIGKLRAAAVELHAITAPCLPLSTDPKSKVLPQVFLLCRI